jgi:hypothetical protein
MLGRMPVGRSIESRYDDPVDLVWLHTAGSFGMAVVRSADVYAAWDGEQTLSLARPEDLDADDSLAQLIFHEICHALVEGPEARQLSDWGLSNRDERDLVREHACHRLQAALADAHGLRSFLAVTTDHRPYYDGLPEDPLAPGEDPAIGPALEGWERARHGPWAGALTAALDATARIARAIRPFTGSDSLWARVPPTD